MKPYCNWCCGYGVISDHLGYHTDTCPKCNGNSSPKLTLSEKLYELAEKWEVDNHHNSKYNTKTYYKISNSNELRNLLLEFGYKKKAQV